MGLLPRAERIASGHDSEHREPDRTFRARISRLHSGAQRHDSRKLRTTQCQPDRRRHQRRLPAPRANVYPSNRTAVFNSNKRTLYLLFFDAARRRSSRTLRLPRRSTRTPQKPQLKLWNPTCFLIIRVCIGCKKTRQEPVIDRSVCGQFRM